LSYVGDSVTDKGQKYHLEVAPRFDGKDYPVKATLDGKPDPNAPDVASATRIDDHTLEYEYKRKGQVVSRGKGILSKDGKTQTHTQTGLTADGKVSGTQTVVFDKQ
jgi:hypothetical protein